MVEKIFDFIYNFVANKLLFVCVFLIALISLSIFLLPSLKFDNNIEQMLPVDSVVSRSLSFLRESNISDKVVVSLSLKDKSQNLSFLIEQTKVLAKSLENELVTEVVAGVPQGDLMSEVVSFTDYYPQLASESDLNRSLRAVESINVGAKISEIFSRLMSPGGSMMLPFLQKDPFSFSSKLLKDINKLASSTGYKINIKSGHFISEDLKNSLLVLKTPVLLTDGFGSKRLLDHISDTANKYTPALELKVIAGHRHSVSNEMVIKRDVRLIAIVATLAFMLLFLCVFRDVRALLLFFIPVVAILLAVILSSFFLGTLSYFVVGFAVVIAGIAIDYGIHIYVALRENTTQKDKSYIVKNVSKPVSIGAVTTLSVFFAFFFSSVNAYNQLALFSIFSIFLCLIISLFLLPHFLSAKDKIKKHSNTIPRSIKPSFVAGIWGGLMIVFYMLLTGVTFNSDVKQFDGSESVVFEDENEFHRIWGGKEQPAVLVFEGDTLEEALQSSDMLTDEASSLIVDGELDNINSIWKSEKVRNENLRRWKQAWDKDKIEILMSKINRSAMSLGFADDAFEPFKTLLMANDRTLSTPELVFFKHLQDRFFNIKTDKVQVLAYFKDTSGNIAAINTLTTKYDSVYVVSRKNLSAAISESVADEILTWALIAGLLIIFFVFFLLRNLRFALLALVPVVSSVFVMFGILPVFGIQLNAIAIISAMVVAGLSIDYGIFVVCSYRADYDYGTKKAVTLSALTTIIGAGALLFAVHPVMFTIGIVLVSGVIAGYMSSIFVIPAFYQMTDLNV